MQPKWDEYALAAVAMLAAWKFLGLVLKEMSRSTDRVIESQKTVAEALQDQQRFCAKHDDKLVQILTARDSELYTRMDARHREIYDRMDTHHTSQMQTMGKILAEVMRPDSPSRRVRARKDEAA
jgi:hypothetical protein